MPCFVPPFPPSRACCTTWTRRRCGGSWRGSGRWPHQVGCWVRRLVGGWVGGAGIRVGGLVASRLSAPPQTRRLQSSHPWKVEKPTGPRILGYSDTGTGTMPGHSSRMAINCLHAHVLLIHMQLTRMGHSLPQTDAWRSWTCSPSCYWMAWKTQVASTRLHGSRGRQPLGVGLTARKGAAKAHVAQQCHGFVRVKTVHNVANTPCPFAPAGSRLAFDYLHADVLLTHM